MALLWHRDPRHEWVREMMAGMRHPLYTCEPVISEAAHLLRRLPGGRSALLGLLANGAVAIGCHLDAELPALSALVARYDSVPMSIADACLVRMTEIMPDSAVLTFDTDFRIYRRGGRQTIPVIMPGKS